MEIMCENRRNYTITKDSDIEDIINGRCPSYSLTWDILDHKPCWPKGHNYFIGNGLNISDDSKILREILSKKLKTGTLSRHIIFCDLDGVLADFEQGVKNRFKKSPEELNSKMMWSIINKSTTFFETLPWMPKGRELWSKIQKYHPVILTGVPNGSNNAIQQKINWCKRELGEDIQVITCLTKEKPNYCLPASILIDDRTDNLKAWNDKGGKFILYDEDYLDPITERIDRHMVEILNSP